MLASGIQERYMDEWAGPCHRGFAWVQRFVRIVTWTRYNDASTLIHR